MVCTILHLVILCGGMHTIPVVLDSEDIPPSEELRYINSEVEEKPRYIDSEDERRPRYIDSTDEGKFMFINDEDKRRPRYSNHKDEGTPRYISHEDEVTPINIKVEGRPRYLTAEEDDTWPDEILLPGFLALQASDLAGYLVSNMAFKLTKALLYMIWL